MQRVIKFRLWNGKEMVNHPYLSADAYKSGWLCNINLAIKNAQDGELVFMQFTGLKDKKNVDIYEGDIVKTVVSSEWDEQVPRDEYGIVGWMGDGWWVKSEGTPDNHRLCDYDWEVTNNIYEAPKNEE